MGCRDLGARVGDTVELDYFVWKPDGQLHTETSKFQVERIVPVDAGDRDLTPPYPGITESRSLRDWDPPFPLDLTRIRPRDEEYWNRYRTTPKAFVRLARGRALWGTRFGSLTSLRIFPASGSRWNLRQAGPRPPVVGAFLPSRLRSLCRRPPRGARPRHPGPRGHPGEGAEPGSGARRHRLSASTSSISASS